MQMFSERASCSGRLPTVMRPAPTKTTTQHFHFYPVVSGTTMSIAAGVIVCLLLFLSYSDRINMGSGAQPPVTVLMGKRNWKDPELTRSQKLELQISLKDEEIDTLRNQLTRLTSSSRMAETNMASQEALIKMLQLKQETEKAAKYKAMYALAERSKNLDVCSKERTALETDLGACQGERARSARR